MIYLVLAGVFILGFYGYIVYDLVRMHRVQRYRTKRWNDELDRLIASTEEMRRDE